MTYAILSTVSGHILESFASRDEAWVAVARMMQAEPNATDWLAVVTFDDSGTLVDSAEGTPLLNMIRELHPELDGGLILPRG